MVEMELAARKRHVRDTTVACPIVYGSIAHWLGKKADESATHRWTLYVRGPNNEDLGAYISQVAFTLHPSFAEPVRVVKQPPFEVTEFGWGEFESSIRIYFKDIDESPVDILHLIKLYYPPPALPNLKKPVISEKYDEIVFTDPSESFLKCLILSGSGAPDKQPAVGENITAFDDANDIQQLTLIAACLQREIAAAKIRFVQLDGECSRLIAAVPNPRTSTSTSAEAVSAVSTSRDRDASGAAPIGSGRSRDRKKVASASNTATSENVSISLTTSFASNDTKPFSEQT